MRCRALILVVLTIWFWPAAPAFAAPAVESFTSKERQALDAATAAWFRGDAPVAVTRLAALVERLDDQRRAALDEILASKQMPSLTQMVTKSRLATLEQGGGKIPKLQVHEALIVLPAIEKRIAETVDAVEKSRTISYRLPAGATLDEYDELLWETHVLSNRVAAAKSIADRASHVIHITPRENERLSEEQRELVHKDYDAVSKQLEQLAAELSDREAELRIQRLDLAIELLKSPELSRERLLAAYYWQIDAGRIKAFLENARRHPRKDAHVSLGDLSDPHVRQQLVQKDKQAASLAGELTAKAAWLFDGLFWWYRGRYGSGTAVFGLAKSKEAAFVPAARFALYMPPERRLQPTDPTKVYKLDEATPRYDRRHHYWWAWEDRRLAVGPAGVGTSGTALAGVRPFY